MRDRDCGSGNERENGYEKREVGEMQGVRERQIKRRVETREAGSVPFSSSQAPIPLGSVVVSFAFLPNPLNGHKILATKTAPHKTRGEKIL